MKYAIIVLILTFINVSGSTVDNVEWKVDSKKSYFSCNKSVVDSNGFVWISTDYGLLMYNGNKVIKVNSLKDINTSKIDRISKDSFGNIFFTTYPHNTIYKIVNNKITKFKANSEIYFNSLYKNSFLFNNENSRFNKLLVEFSEGNFINLRKYNSIRTISTNLVGNDIFIQSNNKLLKYNLKTQTYKKVNIIDHYFLFEINNSHFYFSENKLIVYDNNLFKKDIYLNDNILNSFFKNIQKNTIPRNNFIIDSNGNVYFFNEKSLYKLRFFNGNLKAIFICNTNTNDIIDVEYYKDEDVYFLCSSTKGFGVCKKNKFNYVNNKEKLYKKAVYAVSQLNNDEYYSPSGWIFNVKNKKQYFFNDSNRNYVNEWFIFNYKDKVYYQDTCKIENIFRKDDLLNNQNFCLKDFLFSYCIFDNKIYLSQAKIGEQIVELNKDGYFKQLKLPTKIETNIHFIYEFKGLLILGSERGVFLYDRYKQKLFVFKKLKNTYARNIVKIDDSKFWICTYNEGLYLFSNFKIFKVIDDKNYLKSAHAIEKDKFGNVWISTNDGLYTVSFNHLIKNTLNSKKVELYRYDIEDGLKTNEFNGGSTHPSLNDTINNFIGFPSMNGFLYFDPITIKKNYFNKKIIIEEIKSEDPKSEQKIESSNIPSNVNLLKIKIDYAYHSNRSNIVVEYSLDNGKKWNKVLNNAIFVIRAKEGIQNLKVRIKNADSNKTVVKNISLNFLPRYYETKLFLFSLFVVIILLLFLSFKVGRIYSRRKEQELELKIEKKTKKLNETIVYLEATKEELSQALSIKELLLKEIHHRVKNNLQLVISLLNIQGRKNNYNTIEEFLEKGQTRIMAMVLIHENLYQNDSIERLDVGKYLNNLVNKVLEAFNINNEIAIQIEADNITMNLQTAIPFGLMINEFITNSVKYAFPNQQGGQIKIQLTQNNKEEFKLRLEDNGPGFEPEKLKKKSFGIELIKLLTNQLNGQIDMHTKGKTLYLITFKESLV